MNRFFFLTAALLAGCGASSAIDESTTLDEVRAPACAPGYRNFFGNTLETIHLPAGCGSISIKAWGGGGAGLVLGPVTSNGGGGAFVGTIAPINVDGTTIDVWIQDTGNQHRVGGGLAAVLRSNVNLAIAAGGGGGGIDTDGGAGGGEVGEDGEDALYPPNQSAEGGHGATLTAGGAGGISSDGPFHNGGNGGSMFPGGSSGGGYGGNGRWGGGGAAYLWSPASGGGGGGSSVFVGNGRMERGHGATPGEVFDPERGNAGDGGVNGGLGTPGRVILRWGMLPGDACTVDAECPFGQVCEGCAINDAHCVDGCRPEASNCPLTQTCTVVQCFACPCPPSCM